MKSIFSWTMVLRGNGVLEYAVNWIAPGTGPLGLMFTYPAIIVGLVHSYIPYMILTCYISIEAIDDRLIEADLNRRSVRFRIDLLRHWLRTTAGRVALEESLA